MGRLSRLTALIVVVAGGVYGVLFCLANAQAQRLDLVFVSLPEAPLSVWVLGAFIFGGLLGLAASSIALWRMRLTAAGLRRSQASAAPAVPASGRPDA